MVLMIAEVTKDLIAANKSSLLGSGRKFYEQFLNRTFYTKTGTNYIDSAGVIGGLSKVITQYKPNSTDKMVCLQNIFEFISLNFKLLLHIILEDQILHGRARFYHERGGTNIVASSYLASPQSTKMRLHWT